MTLLENHQSSLQRKLLLFILAYEGVGGILGGVLLIIAPDGRLMDIPVEVMHGFFSNFLIPGVILSSMGVLTLLAFFAVWRKSNRDWLLAGLALVGFTIWFLVEIAILREIHWLHIMWGAPVLVGIWAALPLMPHKKGEIRTVYGNI